MKGSNLVIVESPGKIDKIKKALGSALHWTRKWKRGYNQAEVLGSELAMVLNIELRTDILRRTRRTRTQTKISHKRREKM